MTPFQKLTSLTPLDIEAAAHAVAPVIIALMARRQINQTQIESLAKGTFGANEYEFLERSIGHEILIALVTSALYGGSH